MRPATIGPAMLRRESEGSPGGEAADQEGVADRVLWPGGDRANASRGANERKARCQTGKRDRHREREILRTEQDSSGDLLEEPGDSLQDAAKDARDAEDDAEDDAERPVGDMQALDDEGVRDRQRCGVEVLDREGEADDAELAAISRPPLLSDAGIRRCLVGRTSVAERWPHQVNRRRRSHFCENVTSSERSSRLGVGQERSGCCAFLLEAGLCRCDE